MSGPGARRRWTTWAFALAIFLGGAGVGAGLTVLGVQRSIRGHFESPDELPSRMARRIADDYGLDARDEQRLQTAFRRHHERLMSVREQVMAQVEPELEELTAEISAVLGPEKAGRWIERWKKKRERWGPRRPRH